MLKYYHDYTCWFHLGKCKKTASPLSPFSPLCLCRVERDKLTLVYWQVRTELGVTGLVFLCDLSKLVQVEVCNFANCFCYLT